MDQFQRMVTGGEGDVAGGQARAIGGVVRQDVDAVDAESHAFVGIDTEGKFIAVARRDNEHRRGADGEIVLVDFFLVEWEGFVLAELAGAAATVGVIEVDGVELERNFAGDAGVTGRERRGVRRHRRADPLRRRLVREPDR